MIGRSVHPLILYQGVYIDLLYFRFINIRLLSKVGHYTPSLAKGPLSTTWIWNIHASSHDLILLPLTSYASKILSSHASHLSPVFFWMSRMHYHGAYYSNYHTWLKDSIYVSPSSHLVWSLIGQESVNTSSHSSSIVVHSCNSFYIGIQITSGLFHIWHSTGIYSLVHLQMACLTSLITTIIYISLSICLSNSHLSCILTPYVHYQHLLTLLGPSSISWDAHQSHIALPSYCHPGDTLTYSLDRTESLSNYSSTYTTICIITLSCIHHLGIGIVFLRATLSSYLYQLIYTIAHLDLVQHILT